MTQTRSAERGARNGKPPWFSVPRSPLRTPRSYDCPGTGKAGAGPVEGDPLKVTFNGPKHLCIDRDDNVIIADTENHRIVKYVPYGERRRLDFVAEAFNCFTVDLPLPA